MQIGNEILDYAGIEAAVVGSGMIWDAWVCAAGFADFSGVAFCSVFFFLFGVLDVPV